MIRFFLPHGFGFRFVGLAVLLGAFGQPAQAGELKVATDIWPPFRMATEHGVVGLDIELLAELGARMGAKPEVTRLPWGRGLALMETGAYDMMTGLSYRSERAAYIAYADEPYFTCKTAFYTPSGQGAAINSYEDLKRHVVGYVLNAAYFEKFDKDTSLKKQPIEQEADLVELVAEGRLAVMIGTDCQVDHYIQTHNLGDRIEKSAFSPEGMVDLYVGLSKKSAWAGRIGELNRHLKDLTEEGFVEKLARKYFGDTGG